MIAGLEITTNNLKKADLRKNYFLSLRFSQSGVKTN